MVNYTGKSAEPTKSDYLASKTVEDLMQEYFVSFTLETPLAEAAATFSKYDNLMGGPVVDANNKMVGYLSEHACLKELASSLINNYEGRFVKDFMHHGIANLTPDTPLLTALDRFLNNWYYAFPVVDGNGRCVGVLPRKIVMRHLSAEKPTKW